MTRSSHLIVFEFSDKLVICMNDLAVALAPSLLPDADIFTASVGECVDAEAVPQVVLPLAIICVAVHVEVRPLSASLVAGPIACGWRQKNIYTFRLQITRCVSFDNFPKNVCTNRLKKTTNMDAVSQTEFRGGGGKYNTYIDNNN